MGTRARWPRWNNPRIVLYHGTALSFAAEIQHIGVDTTVGRVRVDFGSGFYTTTWLQQARQWASDKVAAGGGQPAIVKLEIDRKSLSALRTLAFVRGSEDAADFWSFVQHCRTGDLPHTAEAYDIVYGPVAARFGPDEYEIHSGFDQVSFHGSRAQNLLRSPKNCTVTVE